MPFVIPLGRYLGIRRGTDVVNPLTPVRDPDANYAVLQLPNGQMAAPEEFSVLLEAATTAPNLDSLVGKLPELAKRHPSQSADALHQELRDMINATLLIALDPRKDGLPRFVLDNFWLVPGESLALAPRQSEVLTAPDSKISEYEAAGRPLVLNRAFAASVSALPAQGLLLGEVIDRIEEHDLIGDHAQAEGVVELGLQAVLNAQAAYMMAQPY